MIIDGSPITPEDVVAVSRNREKVTLSQKVKAKIKRSRSIVDKAVANKEIIYGITTGFGAFKNTVIDQSQTNKLQENLILSHATGVGDPLPTEVVRGIIFLIVNYLSKGYSGAALETIETFIQMLNKGVHPIVPEKGSVGSSGDLAPSAHVTLVLIGKGEAEYKGKNMTGKRAMAKAGIKPVILSSKEGLAIINNTSTMSSIASLAINDASKLIEIGDLCASLSLQALMGTAKAYDKRIHQIKPHDGQVKTADNMRSLLEGSKLIDEIRIQEAYSFRCVPQIHGAIREAMTYVRKVVTTEINSVTDNPLIFDNEKPVVISGGNFHGEAVAIAMDTLAIALSEIANVSDRRIATLLDPSTNNGLPAFLVIKGGLNSGLMIPQYTTAALVSENKILAHPASVDSVPTSANIEDLVSMGTIAARKAREILRNVRSVLAIEIMTACQAIDIRVNNDKTKILSTRTKPAFQFIRKMVPFFKKDTIYYPYINKIDHTLDDLHKLIFK
ncbi:histidine ammonia-lyase [Candidatus Collierbacteria bacterium]|nr:histidine ammonia-lyase [Candidatus Collierbacteria bacterium]